MGRKFALCFASILLVSCSGQEPEVSATKGYPVSLEHASASIMLRDAQPTQAAIEAYIKKSCPNWGDRLQTVPALAFAIRGIAIDFDIDARILTGLVHQESTFDSRAASGTGAVGLTQVTIPGIDEFVDQSGATFEHLDNKTYAGAGTKYFAASIKKHWTKFPTGKSFKDFAARTAWSLNGLKTPIFSRGDQYVAQLIAGATILKAKIAYSCFRSASCTAAKLGTTTTDTLSMRLDVVRQGLEEYNGEEGKRPDGEIIKVWYARSILAKVDQI
jgi:hypothetical protein